MGLLVKIPDEFFIVDATTPFADISLALKKPNGLIGIGGELSSKRLLNAYSQGIFPWYNDGDPVLWYSPDPRMIITKKSLKISKSLQKIINKQCFEIRVDTDFIKVMQHCKNIIRKNQDGTWINNAMLNEYEKLHHQGFAKSVEVYENNNLVGGLYGISIGKVFFGESMFSLKNNTSKIAFVHLIQNMGYQLIDCQIENPHLKSLGAFNISCCEFNQHLKELIELPKPIMS